MALGRQRDRQSEMLVSWSEMPRSPGHAFYDRLQAELVAAGFDGFVEGLCAAQYAERRGRPSLPPGRYFRMLLVGYFEGIDSERGLEWRCADSLSLREFLRLGERERVSSPAVMVKTRFREPGRSRAGLART
ncbi:transposase [Falsiroseomonas sp.]|uniref:transposase n=1 Tax=Falsiroseomonas sp. TaxID=2870721 RepID=UPI0034A2D499